MMIDILLILEVFIVLVIVSLSIYNIVKRFISVKPNEWLLVLHNGNLIKAGIGLNIFRGFRHTIVRFPSSIQKVPFSAQQVTKEMQGIEVSGFVIWVINREGEGPFKAFKHIAGLSQEPYDTPLTNENIARMAESIVRHQVANLTIEAVLTQREEVRNKIRKEMLDVVSGWGIWLETVEITEVIILSSSLFDDLQTPFRQETRQTAEKIRINTEKDIEEDRLNIELDLSKQRAENKVQQAIYESQKQLEQEKEEEKLFIERQRIEHAKLEHEKEIELFKIEMNAEIKRQEAIKYEERRRAELDASVEREELVKKEIKTKHLTNDIEVNHQLKKEEKQVKQELKLLEQRIVLEATMTPVNLQREILQTIQKIYQDLPIDSVKIVNMGANQGLESIISQIASAIQETKNQLNESTQ